MKRYKIFGILAPLITSFVLVGCATTRDISYLDSKIEDHHQKVRDLEKRIDDLKHELESIGGKYSFDTQKDWADLKTTIENLQMENRIIKANIEEDREFIKKLADELQGLKKGYAEKMPTYEKGKEAPTPVTPSIPSPAVSTPPSAPPPSLPKEMPASLEDDMEGAYQRAYNSFKMSNYPNALSLFKEFLRKYPKSEYGDNAQFWLAECFYMQGDYEKAILEYEKVIKHYPQGDKVPSALLKQGFAFLNLGDRVDAKILFRKVIKEYPRSPQAEIATKKLKLLD